MPHRQTAGFYDNWTVTILTGPGRRVEDDYELRIKPSGDSKLKLDDAAHGFGVPGNQSESSIR